MQCPCWTIRENNTSNDMFRDVQQTIIILNWRRQTRIGLQHQQENLDHVRVVKQNDKMSDSDIFDKWKCTDSAF